MKIHSLLTHLLLAASLIACQDNPSEPNPSPSEPAQGTPTETGQPTGPQISKVIGPGGGTISTPDNVFKMVIPAGALPGDTTITLQTIENKAWGGTGHAIHIEPQNLALTKPATLTWTYTDADVAGSAPEALGIAFQQADRSWLGRQDVAVDKAAKKAAASINKLLHSAFYESYYIVPGLRSLVPAEHAELKVFFHAGHEDASELAPLTMPQQLTQNQVKNWKLNGLPATGEPHPQLGSLAVTGNGASATYVAPGRVPNPNQVAISVQVAVPSKAQLLLVSNMTIEAANAFQLGTARVDSAQIGTISVADGTFFQISLSERDLSDQRQAVISLSMLPFPGVGVYELADDGKIQISGMDRERKSWSDSYHPRAGKKVIGPLSVSILEYDKANRRVKGKISGTLHHYNEKTNRHESTQVSARFNAASPY